MGTESHKRPRIVRFGTFEACESNSTASHLKYWPCCWSDPGKRCSVKSSGKGLWSSDTFVDFDAGVNTAINRLREALNDSAENPRFIETLPRRGYRFIAPVEAENTLCTIYGLLAPPALHASKVLEMILPGFHWLNLGSFLLGLVETFLYGSYIGLVFVPIHNLFSGRLERREKPSVQQIAA